MFFRFTACLSLFFFLAEIQAQQEPVDWVNMMIGTTGDHRSEYGGLIPEVSTPFGMTKWTAVTRENMISKRPYHYDDTTLIGYMGTHQPVVWMGDYGFLTIMPQVDVLRIKADERAVPFSHDHEISRPYYYKNAYDDQPGKRITTEIAATSRCSYFRISYPSDGEGILFLEASRLTNSWEGAEGFIRIIPDRNEIYVFNSDHHEEAGVTSDRGVKKFAGYYVLKFDQPFSEFGTWQHDNVFAGETSRQGMKLGGYVRFANGITKVNIRIGSSFIGFDQASENLQREIPRFDMFDEVVDRTLLAWNEMLGKIRIKTDNQDDRIVFYTMLYRTLQYPREISEYGRYYSAFDGQVHTGTSYNAFSLWDTFRTQHPWLQIIAPERVSEMMQSLVQMFEQGGWMPKWPNLHYTNSMISTHGDVVLADAWINGFRDFDIKIAWASMMKNAFIPQVGNEDWRKPGRPFSFEARAGLREYLKLGYVAADSTRQSASRTLEFALSDFAIAQLAKDLGLREEYVLFMDRSTYYRHIFNPEVGYFQARNYDGSWVPDTESHRTFTEGRYWTYMFCVMQDPPGLIELMGGVEPYLQMLDKNFDGGHYRHDNEPGHHYAYMYNHAGRLDKTQQRLRPIIRGNYRNSPGGLSGNDDAGQMAAWYIMSALGFYPLTPASGIYALGVPYFEEIELSLSGNKVLTIKAEGVSTENHIMTIVHFNGRKLEEPFIPIKELWEGGVLEFSTYE